MDLRIIKDNKTHDLEECGIIVHDFRVSSIPLIAEYGEVDGLGGTVDYGAEYGTRTITVPFTMRAHDMLDFTLLRDFLFNLVLSKESYYIVEKRRPKMLAYQFVDTNEAAKQDYDSMNKVVNGKRYRVRLQNVFELDQMLEYGEGELVFETTNLPFAESVASSMTIHNKGINAESNFWSYGMGIIEEPASRLYKHTGANFKIYNMGDVKVNHYNFDFEIKITNVKDSSNSFELINRTNGTVFKIKNKVNQGDVIEIKKAQVLRNTANYMRNTTRTFIELEPGYNEFEIRGATSATVEFDFKAYYL